jgi:hypothetical protein
VSEFDNLLPEDAEYLLNLPYHLVEADMADDLCELLIEFEFLEYKILASAPQPLIEDYDLALQPSIKLEPRKKGSSVLNVLKY